MDETEKNPQERIDLLIDLKDHECLFCKNKLDCNKRDDILIGYEQYKKRLEDLGLDLEMCPNASFYENWRCNLFEPIAKVNDDIYFQYNIDSSLAIGSGRVVHMVSSLRFLGDKTEYFVCKPNSDTTVLGNKYYGPNELMFPEWKCRDNQSFGMSDRPTYENRIKRCPKDLREDPDLFIVDIENLLPDLCGKLDNVEAMRIVKLTNVFNRDRY